MFDVDGEKYEGDYKGDKRHGQGTCIYSNGAQYVGYWKDGKRQGQGTYTFASGDNSLSHLTLNVLMLKLGSTIFETIEKIPYRFVFLSALICVLKVRVETNSPNL